MTMEQANTHKRLIREHLLNGGSITALEALRDFGCYRLASRISDLRSEGMAIEKTNEIVGDIIKRMLITKWLEPKLGEIFDKYKEKWFGKDGQFKGIDAVINSAKQMEADINNAGNIFNEIYNGLSDNLKEYFAASEDAMREASEKGIATASQESVDELNGRATAIQGHTYNICEYTKQLVATTNLILQSVLNIEGETDGFGARLERMESNLKGVKDTVEDIALKGIKIQ